MKYLLWFFLYVVNNEPHPIRTYVLISRDSIAFYVYDFNYVKWKIDERVVETLNETYYPTYSSGFKGVYTISYKDIKGVAYITENYADISLSADGFSEHIQLYKYVSKK